MVLSPKIIYFCMKNLIHIMRNMNVTNSLKSSVFDKISPSYSFGGLREDQNISLATDRLTDYGFCHNTKSSTIGGTKDYASELENTNR